MDKQQADKIIVGHLERMYAFSVRHTFSYDEAEELCANITEQVYTSLLRCARVDNVDGYISGICRNTYVSFVESRKKHAGVSIDSLPIPYEEEFYDDSTEQELARLRREIAFLTENRRRVVWLFYYKNKTVSEIARLMNIPAGTVKWHLNKARSEIKEGIYMERKIGRLGLSPVSATGYGHGGTPGKKGGPEAYLGNRLDLNIVYSVYYSPKTQNEIAEELGITPVFIEDRVEHLEKNGFLVRGAGGRFTTYVKFNTPTYSREFEERKDKKRLEIAEMLVRDYVPAIREAVASFGDVYIPSGNRELFEAAVIFYAVSSYCGLDLKRDESKYFINTTDGGRYIATVKIPRECVDPEYVPTLEPKDWWSCGHMTRWTDKYPGVFSWSIDSRLDTRVGGWENNLDTDYDYVYEYITGNLPDTKANESKYDRLRQRGLLGADGRVQIMIVKDDYKSFFGRIPRLDPGLKQTFYDFALECAMTEAKDYPPQMQDLIVKWGVGTFVGNRVSLMVMDILYADGTFKPLTDQERITANLLMFSDVLPNQ